VCRSACGAPVKTTNATSRSPSRSCRSSPGEPARAERNYQRISIDTGFGGVGHSGFGREHTQETLAEYGYTKTIRLAATRDELQYWTAAARVLAG